MPYLETSKYEQPMRTGLNECGTVDGSKTTKLQITLKDLTNDLQESITVAFSNLDVLLSNFRRLYRDNVPETDEVKEPAITQPECHFDELTLAIARMRRLNLMMGELVNTQAKII